MDNLFEKATRIPLRYESNRGLLTTEDLWNLSLTDLDRIAKSVNKAIKEEDGEETFIPTTSRKTSDNSLRLEVLKYIIGIKVEENAVRKNAAEKSAQAARIKELPASKRDQALSAKSEEELLKELQALEG